MYKNRSKKQLFHSSWLLSIHAVFDAKCLVYLVKVFASVNLLFHMSMYSVRFQNGSYRSTKFFVAIMMFIWTVTPTTLNKSTADEDTNRTQILLHAIETLLNGSL